MINTTEGVGIMINLTNRVCINHWWIDVLLWQQEVIAYMQYECRADQLDSLRLPIPVYYVDNSFKTGMHYCFAWSNKVSKQIHTNQVSHINCSLVGLTTSCSSFIMVTKAPNSPSAIVSLSKWVSFP